MTGPAHSMKRYSRFAAAAAVILSLCVISDSVTGPARAQGGGRDAGVGHGDGGAPAPRKHSHVRPVPTASVLIKAGCYRRGTTVSVAYRDERPVHRVCLSAFRMDTHEVTVQAYRRCVAAGHCSVPRRHGSGYSRYCNYGAPGRGNHPVNCVDWFQARAYCRWARKRLPTEAEWERAARGSDGRRYPWGDTRPNCTRAVMASRGDGCGKDRTWPVGLKPLGKSPFGLVDMAGNVGEWVKDCYSSRAYARCAGGCRNPVNACAGNKGQRIYRGGTWVSGPDGLRATLRKSTNPTVRVGSIGFRCAAPAASR